MVPALVRDVLSPSDYRALPVRIQRNITDQQTAGEVLVGWIQLFVVVTFGSLYAIAPKTFAADAALMPVPWALGGYFLFTLVRLGLAYRGRLGGGFKALSAVVDIALLLVLIWSFHIQYEQPASFVLKAPTLLYVFIFIALRTLLFEANMVVLTGIAAAVGWLVLVFVVVAGEAGEQLITRDYVQYITSNAVLLGAEFDKVVSILVVTAVLAVAMVRARNLLVRAVAEGARVQDLSQFFAPEVAQQITEAETAIRPGQGEAREAAILFVDIRGFTEMASTVKPDDLISFLGDYQSRLIPPIKANGGTSEKFLGDGMMAAFGAAVSRETYAADAVRAADGIIAGIEDWNRERVAAGLATIEIGIAISCGRIVFGAVGGETRLEYAVVGHPVNLAAKLEKHNKSEGARALCTAEVYERALEQGYDGAKRTERLPDRQVEGLAESVDLIVLAR